MDLNEKIKSEPVASPIISKIKKQSIRKPSPKLRDLLLLLEKKRMGSF